MHLYLYFNEKILSNATCSFMYVCMHVFINFTVKIKCPCCCFTEAPALIPLQCSLNVDVKVELTHGTRLGMYGKALGYSLDF